MWRMFAEQKRVGFVALSLALLIIVAACSSGDEDDSTPSTQTTQPSQAAQAAPTQAAPIQAVPQPTAAPTQSPPPEATTAKVERLVFAMLPPRAEGNAPGRDFFSPDAIQLRPMYDYLVGVDPQDGSFIPSLATEWNVESDGQSLRFKLRKGVQLHENYGEFTAKDVVHTHWDIIQEDSVHSSSGLFRTIVESIEVVNDYEVVFRATKPSSLIFNRISELVGGFEIQSKDHFDVVGKPNLATNPIVGTGAYQFSERRVSDFVRFERVPYDHWRRNADFAEFEMRYMLEASSRLAGILTGEVHLATLPEDLQIQAVQAGSKVVFGNVPGLRTFLQIDCCPVSRDGTRINPDAPMQDIKIRKALSKAINRAELNPAFFGGKAEDMILNHFHPTRMGWNSDWEGQFADHYGYDPAAARTLLREAGFDTNNPFEVNVHVIKLPNYGGSEDVVESVASYFRDVGVNAKLVSMDGATRNSKNRARELTNDLIIIATSSDILLGNEVYVAAGHAASSKYEDARLSGLFGQLRGTVDPIAQAALLRQMGDTAFDLHQSIPLFWLRAEVTINPDVVSNYVFPGSISGSWTHLENIFAAR